MTIRTRTTRRARQAARDLLRDQPGGLPVNVEAIASALGIVVLVEELDDDVSGLLKVQGGRAVIGVNAAHHPNRRRFTVAHELAHHVLHLERATFFLDAGPAFFRSDAHGWADGRLEREANAFAAELLMPADAVHAAMRAEPIDVYDEAAVRGMADRFGVSTQALLIRLTELDLDVP